MSRLSERTLQTAIKARAYHLKSREQSTARHEVQREDLETTAELFQLIFHFWLPELLKESVGLLECDGVKHLKKSAGTKQTVRTPRVSIRDKPFLSANCVRS